MPQVFGPWIFDGDGFSEGGLVVSKGRIAEVIAGQPEGIKRPTLLLPLLANAHTHLGDAFIKCVPRGNVGDIVAPPDGFKFRMLAKATPRQVVVGMRSAIQEMAATGTGHFADFREGGTDGVATIRMAMRGQKVEAKIFGRPCSLSFVEAEMTDILRRADGIGISSISDWPRRDLYALATLTHAAGKPFSIHVSERSREPLGDVLALEPSFVVHMVKASVRDFRECADNGVPIVVCPRSNAFFSMKPPVRRMLDAGATVALGTDNAMLAWPDMLAEARFLAKSQRDLSLTEVVHIAVAGGRKVLNLEPGLRPKRGDTARFVAVAYSGGDPVKGLLSPKARVACVFGL